MGSFKYYVSTFLGVLDPPFPQFKHIFSTESKQKFPFSDPPPPFSCAYLRNIWMVPIGLHIFIFVINVGVGIPGFSEKPIGLSIQIIS